jgi:hypothetical protein
VVHYVNKNITIGKHRRNSRKNLIKNNFIAITTFLTFDWMPAQRKATPKLPGKRTLHLAGLIRLYFNCLSETTHFVPSNGLNLERADVINFNPHVSIPLLFFNYSEKGIISFIKIEIKKIFSS